MFVVSFGTEMVPLCLCSFVQKIKEQVHSVFMQYMTVNLSVFSQVVAGEDVMLPGDEIWLCDLDSGTW